jgi:hypothetical protein
MRMAKRKSPYLPKHDFFLQGFLSTGRTIEWGVQWKEVSGISVKL